MEIVHKVQQLTHTQKYNQIERNNKKENKKRKENQIKSTGTQKVNGTINIVPEKTQNGKISQPNKQQLRQQRHNTETLSSEV